MQSKGRAKLFIENFLVYGLGGMISRFIPLIMLPIIAKLYPSPKYIGLNDLSHTFISFAQALAVCGMYDSMFRLFFDQKSKDWQKKICSTAFVFVSCMSIVLSAICFVLRKQIASWYFEDEKYETLVVLTIVGFLISSTNQIISAPTRIQNKRKIFLVTNTVSPAIAYLVAIPLILAGHYIIAMPIATAIAGFTLEMSFAAMNREYFSLKSFGKPELSSLLKIGLPLMPNFLVYWIYNSADKVMINKILGTDFTGVYGVASRIGHISNLIYTAFAGGWLYFAYSTMNDDDQVQMKSNIFEYMGAVSFAATACLMSVSRLGFRIFFDEEYLAAYLISPYLFMAPLLLMLYQIIANQFTIAKKTYMNLLALSVGAAVNVILNYVLIHAIGSEGASIATVTGYIVSILMCLFWLRRMKLININKKVYINSAVMLAFFLVWRFFCHDNYILSFVSSAAVIGVFVFMYKDMLLGIIRKRRKKK